MTDTTEKQMTKSEARAFLKRAREAMRYVEQDLRDGNGLNMPDDLSEAIGALVAISDALDDHYGRGIRGVSKEG